MFLSFVSQAVSIVERFRIPKGSRDEYISSGDISKKEISLWGICMSKSGRVIMAVESSEQPKIAVNSSINGYNSWLLNLKTWSLGSQKVAAAYRRAVSIFRYYRDRKDLTWKGCNLFQSFPLRLLRKVFISWREAWVMIILREKMKIISPLRPLYRHKIQSRLEEKSFS